MRGAILQDDDRGKDERDELDAQDDGEAAGQVPVPRMRAVERADVFEHVELEEFVGSDEDRTVAQAVHQNGQQQHDRSLKKELLN